MFIIKYYILLIIIFILSVSLLMSFKYKKEEYVDFYIELFGKAVHVVVELYKDKVLVESVLMIFVIYTLLTL